METQRDGGTVNVTPTDDAGGTYVVRIPPHDQRVGTRETIPHWTPSARIALGLCTLALPAVATLIGAAGIAAGSSPSPLLPASVVGFVLAQQIVVFLYVAFAGQNPRLYSALAWQLSFVFAGLVALPVYWVIHVWGAPRLHEHRTITPAPRENVVVGLGPVRPLATAF